MDGVPGLSFRGIAPGETFIYRIPVKQRQVLVSQPQPFPEQTGLVGALHIEPKHRDPIESDRDDVLLLTDWTDENPATVFDNLKKQSDYYNYYRRTAGTFFSDAKKKSLRAAVSDRLMWGRMNMTPTDIADVTSATYTYLVNGAPPAANWTALFEPGQRVRLRFINGSSMTLFDVRAANLGRRGNPGTRSVFLRNRTDFLLSRWRSRRAVQRFMQPLDYAAADSTASDRTQFLQHTRSWPGHRDGLIGSRRRRPAGISDRKFAPYVGFTYTGLYGETAATFARNAGQRSHAPRLAVGIWVWR